MKYKLSSTNGWSPQMQECADDYIDRIDDGFDWYEGDQYGMVIVLKSALNEIERLRTLLEQAK